MKQSRLSIKLRGKISHACNSVITILSTTRRKQLQGTSCNLESFVMLTFCFSWFFYCNDRELCYFSNYTTFSSQRKNLESDGQMLLMILAQMKQQDVQRWWKKVWVFHVCFFFFVGGRRPWIEVRNRVSCACLQSKGIFHYSLIDVSISWSCFDKT